MHTIDYTYLRPKKAEWLRRMYATPLELRKTLSVWQGNNATVLPLRRTVGEGLLFGRGGVIDNNGQYVPLSGFETRIMHDYPHDPPIYEDQKVVFCGYLVNHWGHFLVEAVTRLWYVQREDHTIDKYVFFVNENEERVIKGNYKEFFQLLNIWDKLEIVNKPTTFREVIVPELAFFCMRYYSQEYLDIFETVCKNITLDPSWETLDKIYFTRSNFAKENNYEFGLESMDSFFANNHFVPLAPEKLSLSHMIFYLHNAKEIATISGSAHHNLLFAPTNAKITIIERLVVNVDYQVSINRFKQFQVTPIDANFHLYPVDTCGPYIIGQNHILEQYIIDKHLNAADPHYTTKEYRDNCFKKYMKSYQDNYRYRWFMAHWYAEICDSLYEAYEDNYPYFKDYLDGNVPCLPEHNYQIHYIKQFIKKILAALHLLR